MPNLESLKAKVDVTGDLGETYDQMLQAAEREAHGREGAEQILKTAAKLVLKLHEHVDKDFEAGELPKQELQIVSYVKKYVTRASECLQNLASKMEAEKLVANGKVAALRPAVDLVQRHHNSAVAVYKQVETELKETNGKDPRPTARGPARAPGQHPGPSPLAERRAEAKRLKEERLAASETTDKTAKTGVKASAKRKRGARRKASSAVANKTSSAVASTSNGTEVP